MIFNPAVPDSNDPNYLSYSRPISQPESDKSAVYAGQAAEYRGKKDQALGEAAQYEGKAEAYEGQAFGELFKGLGDIFTSAVKSADSVIKAQADAEIYSAVDAQRTAYTEQLKQVQANLPAVAPGQGTVQSDELSGQSRNTSTPREIEDGLSQAEAMTQARDNGKMTQTGYISSINQLAQRLRSRYAGHRDYIDTKMAEVTGMNPANALVRSLVQDINTSIAAQQAGKNKLESKILQHVDDIPGLQNDYFAWKRGEKSDNEVLGKINKALSWKLDLEQRKAIRSDFTGTIEERRQAATQHVSDLAGQKIQLAFSSIMSRIPADVLKRINEGEIMDPTEVQKIGQQVLAARQGTFQAIYGDALQMGYNKSYSLGAANLTKEINDQMAVFDSFTDRLLKGDASAAVAMAKQSEAIIERTGNQMLNEPNALGVYTRTTSAGRKLGGDLMVQKITQGTLGLGLQQSTEKWLERQLQKLPVPPADGGDTTPKNILDTAKKAGVAVPKINQTVVNQINHLSDPKIGDEAKVELLKKYVDPKNYGFVGEFSQDRWNTPDGLHKPGAQFIRGRSDAFSQITSAKNVNAVWDLAGKYDANLTKQYRDFVDYSFTKDLYQRDVGNLNEIAKDKFMNIGWNSTTNEIIVIPNQVAIRSALATSGKESAMEGIIDQRLRFYQNSVANLNKGVAGLVNVARKMGVDPDVYVLQTLRGANVGIGGFAEKLTSSMAAQRGLLKVPGSGVRDKALP